MLTGITEEERNEKRRSEKEGRRRNNLFTVFRFTRYCGIIDW
jgi:hypothetical protein